jgi:Tol biopolymer transport system component
MREDRGTLSRTETVNLALLQNNLFDCATYPVGNKPVLPTQKEIFSIVQNIKVTPDDGNEYLGAVWSPASDALVFVVATNERREIPNQGSSSNTQTRPAAVGKSKLLLYSPSRNTWEQISSDGARPVWSGDGRSIYFMGGTAQMQFDLGTRKTVSTGLSVPNTGVGLLFSRPLSDGRLLAPQSSTARLEIRGGQATRFGSIDVTESDQIFMSPNGDDAILVYSASMSQGQLTPAVTVLRHSNGEVIPLLKNCQGTALKMVWSPNGDKIAYPLHADPPEVRIYDVQSNQTQVVFRSNTFEHLDNVSWSPDGKYLAFTRGDGRGSPAPIWVISTDGVIRQQIAEDGFGSNWSPDGKQVLYSRGNLKSWYLLKINTAVNTMGK